MLPGIRAFFSLGGIPVLGMLALRDCNPPPTVDLAAVDLDVTITVIDTERNPSDHKVPIVVQFFSHGKFVQLATSASVRCNGVVLAWNGLGYAERVPQVAPGGSYNCSHMRSGVTATASLVVPPRPVLLSPAPGPVTRSSALALAYAPGGGIGVRGSAGDGSTGLGGGLQPDNGAYSGFNVSALHAGPGSLGLTRELTMTLLATGFKSVTVKYSTGSDISVTWL